MIVKCSIWALAQLGLSGQTSTKDKRIVKVKKMLFSGKEVSVTFHPSLNRSLHTNIMNTDYVH